MEERKETVLGEVNSYEITRDGKKMLVKIDKDYAMIDLPKDKIDTKDKVTQSRRARHACSIATPSGRRSTTNPGARCATSSTRRTCTASIGRRRATNTRALVPFVNHRNDLTYLFGELISELNIGHAYVGGGERPETPRIKLGLLGAELSRDPATKAYKIERILPGENWDKRTRSPLTMVGVNVKPGDYILAVNGTPVARWRTSYELLVGTADKQVILTRELKAG